MTNTQKNKFRLPELMEFVDPAPINESVHKGKLTPEIINHFKREITSYNYSVETVLSALRGDVLEILNDIVNMADSNAITTLSSDILHSYSATLAYVKHICRGHSLNIPNFYVKNYGYVMDCTNNPYTIRDVYDNVDKYYEYINSLR